MSTRHPCGEGGRGKAGRGGGGPGGGSGSARGGGGDGPGGERVADRETTGPRGCAATAGERRARPWPPTHLHRREARVQPVALHLLAVVLHLGLVQEAAHPRRPQVFGSRGSLEEQPENLVATLAARLSRKRSSRRGLRPASRRRKGRAALPVELRRAGSCNFLFSGRVRVPKAGGAGAASARATLALGPLRGRRLAAPPRRGPLARAAAGSEGAGGAAHRRVPHVGGPVDSRGSARRRRRRRRSADAGGARRGRARR